MSSTVRIYWGKDYDTETKWDEVCAWAVEYFGLPGNRFQAHPNIDYMDFVFNSNKDALIMAIRWSAEIVPEEQITVEHVGKFLQ